MADAHKPLTVEEFQELLAKYPELMDAHTEEDLKHILAGLPEEIPFEIWDFIEPTIVNDEEFGVEQKHEKEQKHDKKPHGHSSSSKKKPAETSLAAQAQIAHSLDEDPEYNRLKSQRKREWQKMIHSLL
jgi:hypothetical protein